MSTDRLFCGVFPTGLMWADRSQEDRSTGDYTRLAFLSFATLELDVKRKCPPDLRRRIVADAAEIQARRGAVYRVSTCGQYVILGGR